MNRLSFAALLFANEAQAWWGTGHLLTARVAYDVLSEDRPDVVAFVEKELSVLA